MVARLQTIWVAVCCLAPCLLVGCMQGPEIEQARQAELAGAPHTAYDLYCRAAEFDRHDRWLAHAIGRVAPEAAKHWERLAHQAMDRGDYAEAWRLFVRVLEIQPSHPSAPHLIRRLERDHAEAIRVVKADWESSGAQRLGTIRTGSLRAQPETSKPSSPVGTSAGGARPAPVAPSVPKPTRADRSPAPVPPPSASTGLPSPAQTEPPVGPIQPSTRPHQPVPPFKRVVTARETVGPQAGPGVGPAKLGPSKATVVTTRATASRPSGATSRPAPRGARQARAITTRPTARAPVRSPGTGHPGRAAYPGVSRRSPFQFVAIRTLSKKDRRFPKKVRTVDGLTVELRDTDDDPDADFYVYLGDRRVAKYKGVSIGRPCPVVGQSGKIYEVVVLSIVDSRRTIRFGIRPAARSSRP